MVLEGKQDTDDIEISDAKPEDETEVDDIKSDAGGSAGEVSDENVNGTLQEFANINTPNDYPSNDTPLHDEISTIPEDATMPDAAPSFEAAPVDAADDEVFSWHPNLIPIIEEITPLINHAQCNWLSPAFFVTFWQLQLYDIIVPERSYEEDKSKIQKKLRHQHPSDSRGILKAKPSKESDKLERQLKYLEENLTTQRNNKASVMRRLARESKHWFENATTQEARDGMVNDLIQQCFIPRVVFSPNDANFCFEFLRLMHAEGTSNFSTAIFLDRLLSEDISTLAFAFTQHEAENYGRFVSRVLWDLSNWRTNSKSWSLASKSSLPGFRKSWEIDPGSEDEAMLTWAEYKKLLYKWHQKLFQVSSIVGLIKLNYRLSNYRWTPKSICIYGIRSSFSRN